MYNWNISNLLKHIFNFTKITLLYKPSIKKLYKKTSVPTSSFPIYRNRDLLSLNTLLFFYLYKFLILSLLHLITKNNILFGNCPVYALFFFFSYLYVYAICSMAISVIKIPITKLYRHAWRALVLYSKFEILHEAHGTCLLIILK